MRTSPGGGWDRLLFLRAWRVPLLLRMIWLLGPLWYLLLIHRLYPPSLPHHLLPLLLSLFFYYSYAVLLNDYFDLEKDLLSGKGVVPLGRTEFLFLSLLTLLACLLSSLPLEGKPFLLAGLILATLYSLPGARLKERGLGGMLTDVLVELMPLLLVLSFFLEMGGPTGADLILLLLLYLFLHLSSELEHQLKDYERDQKAGVSTFVAQRGLEVSRRCLKIFSLLTLLLLASLLLLSLPRLPSLLLPLAGFGLFFLFHPKLNPDVRGAFEVPLAFADWVYLFFLQVLPLYLSLLLALAHPPYLYLLPLTLLFDLKLILLAMERWRRIHEGGRVSRSPQREGGGGEGGPHPLQGLQG